MSDESRASESRAPDVDTAFAAAMAAAGLDASDPERVADLRRRVTLLRQGLARLDEIPVAGAESPSVFVAVRAGAGS